MFKCLKNKRAQVLSAEYVLIFIIVIGMVSGMTIYFKRAIQGQMFDAGVAMSNIVMVRTSGHYTTLNLFNQYEPYYLNTVAYIDRIIDDQTEIAPGASSGIFKKTVDEYTYSQQISVTAPPNEAK